MNRRRFLSISAAAIGVAALGAAQNRAINWQGMAFGADACITLYGDKAQAREALAMVEREIREMERSFSLYDPQSEISQLNARGALERPSAAFREVLRISEFVHQNTQGRFDPTIQPLWQGRVKGAIGFEKLEKTANGLRFAKPNMALTFNGIAQGFATDKISERLSDCGFAKTLVNMGEYRANRGRFVLAIENQYGQGLGEIGLEDQAIATSAPFASHSIGNAPHILNPRQDAPPLWRTVSVVAENASLADGFSTALSFASTREIEHLLGRDIGLREVIVETREGEVIQLRA